MLTDYHKDQWPFGWVEWSWYWKRWYHSKDQGFGCHGKLNGNRAWLKAHNQQPSQQSSSKYPGISRSYWMGTDWWHNYYQSHPEPRENEELVLVVIHWIFWFVWLDLIFADHLLCDNTIKSIALNEIEVKCIAGWDIWIITTAAFRDHIGIFHSKPIKALQIKWNAVDIKPAIRGLKGQLGDTFGIGWWSRRSLVLCLITAEKKRKKSWGNLWKKKKLKESQKKKSCRNFCGIQTLVIETMKFSGQ